MEKTIGKYWIWFCLVFLLLFSSFFKRIGHTLSRIVGICIAQPYTSYEEARMSSTAFTHREGWISIIYSRSLPRSLSFTLHFTTTILRFPLDKAIDTMSKSNVHGSVQRACHVCVRVYVYASISCRCVREYGRIYVCVFMIYVERTLSCFIRNEWNCELERVVLAHTVVAVAFVLFIPNGICCACACINSRQHRVLHILCAPNVC